MKVVIDEDTDRVLGVHILGDGAAEMIQMVGVALTANATWKDFQTNSGTASDDRGGTRHAQRLTSIRSRRTFPFRRCPKGP